MTANCCQERISCDVGMQAVFGLITDVRNSDSSGAIKNIGMLIEKHGCCKNRYRENAFTLHGDCKHPRDPSTAHSLLRRSCWLRMTAVESFAKGHTVLIALNLSPIFPQLAVESVARNSQQRRGATPFQLPSFPAARWQASAPRLWQSVCPPAPRDRAAAANPFL